MSRFRIGDTIYFADHVRVKEPYNKKLVRCGSRDAEGDSFIFFMPYLSEILELEEPKEIILPPFGENMLTMAKLWATPINIKWHNRPDDMFPSGSVNIKMSNSDDTGKYFVVDAILMPQNAKDIRKAMFQDPRVQENVPDDQQDLIHEYLEQADTYAHVFTEKDIDKKQHMLMNMYNNAKAYTTSQLFPNTSYVDVKYGQLIFSQEGIKLLSQKKEEVISKSFFVGTVIDIIRPNGIDILLIDLGDAIICVPSVRVNKGEQLEIKF